MTSLNSTRHRTALFVFLLIVLAHWAEHLVQAAQIWVLGWPIPEARGVLGLWFPWLVKSEALHYGYAVVMLVGFVLLRRGFTGRSRVWWNIALGIQVWHHFEHLLLLVQAVTGNHLLGRPAVTSVAQLVFPGLSYTCSTTASSSSRWSSPCCSTAGPTLRSTRR